MAEGKAAPTKRPSTGARTRQKSGFKNGESALAKRPAQPPIRCPECTSQRVWRDGVRSTKYGDVQRWLCRDCGLRFSDPTAEFQVKVDVPSQRFKMFNSGSRVSKRPVREAEFSIKEASDGFSLSLSENVTSHDTSKIASGGKSLRVFRPHTSNCRVSVSEVEMKNLAKVEPQQEKAGAGATTKQFDAKIKGKIIEYLWWMKKEGYAESTITRRVRLLKTLSKRGADLLDPESIKLTIARQEGWSSTTKEHGVTAYTSFLKMLGGTWKPPKYKRVRKLPFIPTEEEVNQLIAGCNRKTSAFLKLLKETGVRSGEAWNLEWTDFNFEDKTVSITPEKGGNPRVLGISSELIAMLKALPKTSHKVFPGSLRHFRRSFRRQRKRIAHKLQNPRVNHITFHTLRHWKATMEYHRTKDILHVKQLLGHKNINSTLMYTQLVNFKEDEFYVRVANNVDEACELVEAGFQYVTGEYGDGGKIFRKRK